MIFKQNKTKRLSLASKILIGMLLGFIIGFLLKILPHFHFIEYYLVNGILETIGKLFIALLKMLVVPIVFVSLVCGTAHLDRGERISALTFKVLGLFLMTTVIAIIVGLICASLFHIGAGAHAQLPVSYKLPKPTTIRETILNLIPTNPIQAMTEGNLLQIIIFSFFLGIAIPLSGAAGKRVAQAFDSVNTILIKLVHLVVMTAPYGVFCLIATAVYTTGVNLVEDLLMYCFVMIFALAVQLFGIYGGMLAACRLNPVIFFQKMASIMVFSFSTSSSSATLPLALEATEEQLGVDNSTAAFTIPLGITIHKDGTAIMQGVASIFIANIYHISLSMSTYVAIIATTTLASIGTAGIPSVGVITLAMVLQQAGLPVEGIGLLLGVDRLMDMLRTVVNVVGNTAIACVVSKSEKTLNTSVYNDVKISEKV